MALDRTWFNTLVDDDGSNTVGTVWNKAQIDGLLDTVDAESLRLDGGWQWFGPTLGADAGLFTGTAYVRYKVAGRAVTVLYSIEGGSVTVATATLYVSLPIPGVGLSAGTLMTPGLMYVTTAWETGMSGITTPFQYLHMKRLSGATFPAGAIALRGQITYEI